MRRITTALYTYYSLLLVVLMTAAAGPASAMATTSSCAVVGVGVLGTSLCQQILSAFPNDNVTVTGITKTSHNHDAIRQDVGLPYGERFQLMRNSDPVVGSDSNNKFTNVVFCAPPSGFDDYPAAVQEAAQKYWAGPEGGGIFCFTSSGAV